MLKTKFGLLVLFIFGSYNICYSEEGQNSLDAESGIELSSDFSTALADSSTNNIEMDLPLPSEQAQEPITDIISERIHEPEKEPNNLAVDSGIDLSSEFSTTLADFSTTDISPTIELELPQHIEPIQEHITDIISVMVHEQETAPNGGVTLRNFREEYPQFDYGISSITNMYDQAQQSKLISSSFRGIFDKVLSGGWLLSTAACAVTRSLSLYHSEYQYIFGPLLSALYIGKAVLYGVSTSCASSSKTNTFDIINDFNSKPHSRDSLQKLIEEVSDIKYDGLLSTAKSIEDLAKKETLANGDSAKLSRFSELISQLSGPGIIKKIISGGEKLISSVAGISSGISIAAVGQNAPSSYWLTLASGTLDAITDNSNDPYKTAFLCTKYSMTCEMLYLCEHFEQLIRVNHNSVMEV